MIIGWTGDCIQMVNTDLRITVTIIMVIFLIIPIIMIVKCSNGDCSISFQNCICSNMFSVKKAASSNPSPSNGTCLHIIKHPTSVQVSKPPGSAGYVNQAINKKYV